jgi:hypothetical protein
LTTVEEQMSDIDSESSEKGQKVLSEEEQKD